MPSWAQLALWAKPCLKRWLNVSSVGEIYALARNESAGEQLRFGGKTITVQDAAEFDWTQAQLAFFVAGKEATAAWVEEATNSGCLVIDSSGLFALEPDVPLVVPEVNPFVLTDYRNRNVIAVPDSLTSQLLAALKPLIDQAVYHVSALPA